MNITVFDADGPREAGADDLPALLAAGEGLIWVDMTGPDEDDLRAMREVFRFHPLAIEDTHNQRQRPKIEDYGDYLFIILNTLAIGPDGLAGQEVDVFLGERYLVTVHETAEPVIEEARRRIGRGAKNLAASADHLLYAVLDATVDGYFPVIDRLEETIDELGDHIMIQPDQAMLGHLFDLKRRLIDIWRVVWPQREVINNLAHQREAFLSQEDLRYYLRDVSDHLLWIADMVNTLRDTLTGMMDLYMSATSNRLNVVVNRLTVLAVVIGVMTVISGFYGMNFARTWPPFESPWGVGFVVALMAALAGVLLGALRRLRWY